jgi:very-short-patch-repair endonuclease
MLRSMVNLTAADALVRQLTRATDGVVTRQQLAELGVSRDVIRHRVSQGLWARPHRGVLVVAAQVTDPVRTAARAALLAAPAGSVVSHLLAAHLYGLAGLPERGLPQVTAPMSVGRRSTPGLVVHRSKDLDAVLVDKLRTASIARTLSDIAPACTEPQLLAAMDSALRLRLLVPDDLTRVAKERACHRGGPALVRLADLADGSSDSALESWVRLVLHDGGLPAPELQVRVTHAGVTYRIDLGYPSVRLGIEADGRGVHGTPEAVLEDRRRQNALQLEGWFLLRFTWDDVARRPWYVVATVRAALAKRSSEV